MCYLENMKQWIWMGMLSLVSAGVAAQVHQVVHERWPVDVREWVQSASVTSSVNRAMLGTSNAGSATSGAELLEVDSAGVLLQSVSLSRPAGQGDIQLLHLEPNGGGYVACGHALWGAFRAPVVVTLTSTFQVLQSRVYPGTVSTPEGNLASHGAAMHVTPDGAGGFVVSGIAGDSTVITLGSQASRSAMAMRLGADLSATWIKRFDSPAAAGQPDFDAFNHALVLPTGEYFFSGSSNTLDNWSEASAVLLDASGTVVWAKQFGRNESGVHNSLSGDAQWDDTSGRIHQLVNHSYDHTWTVATWDLQGNFYPERSWVSDYPNDNWQGLSLMRSVSVPGRWVVAGFHRFATWQGEGITPLSGMTPFLTEFDMDGQVYFSREYLIPQANATLLSPTDELSTLVGQEARFKQPQIAVPVGLGNPPGYSLHGYLSDPATAAVSAQVTRVNTLGQSPCPSRQVYTSLGKEPWEIESTIAAGGTMWVDPATLALDATTPPWVSATCGSGVAPLECMETEPVTFNVTEFAPSPFCASGCEALFDGFLPSGYNPDVHCVRISFGDGAEVQFSGVPPLPVRRCYDPLQWNATLPVACIEILCCQDQTVLSSHCETLDFACFENPIDPFDPVDPDPVNECGVEDGALFGLEVNSLGNGTLPDGTTCCEVAVCPELLPGSTLDMESLCVRMDFGDGTVVEDVPFAQCQLHCLELGSHVISAEAYCCDDPDGFVLQAVAVHTCLPLDCPGDLDGDQSVGVGDLLEMLSLFGSSCD